MKQNLSRNRRSLVPVVVAALELSWRASASTLLAILVCTVATAGVPVATAWLMKVVLDRLAGPASTLAYLFPPAAGFVCLGLAAVLLPRVTRFLRSEADRAATLLARDRLYAAVERIKGIAPFEDPVFLDRLQLAQQASGQATHGLIETVSGVMTVAAFVGSLIVLSPVMAGVVLAAGVPVLIAQMKLSRRLAGMMWGLSPVERREFSFRTLLSSVDAAKEIRLFGTGPFLRNRMVTELKAVHARRRRMDKEELVTHGGLALISAGVAGGGLIWAIALASARSISIGDVSMFIAAIAGVQGAVTLAASAAGETQQQLLLFQHYLDVVREVPRSAGPMAGRSPLPELRRGIEFKDVWFRYSDDHPWVLCGIDLFIPYGQAVAMVGRNGSGKSTLVKLLCRFYDPTRGVILWDGVDLRDVSVDVLRDRIGVVFQDFMEYDMTAQENIALGDVSAMGDEERVRNAARKANIDDVLRRLPHGYDTMLTRMFTSEADRADAETGVLLSGGQWQRVALARAFLRDRRDLLILDEPSSGLDAVAEHELYRGLREHRAERTSVLISHRLGALRDADLIVVLSERKIVEQGTHGRLMALDGHYANLFTLQASGYAPEAPAC